MKGYSILGFFLIVIGIFIIVMNSGVYTTSKPSETMENVKVLKSSRVDRTFTTEELGRVLAD